MSMIYTEEEVRELPFVLPSDFEVEQDIDTYVIQPSCGSQNQYFFGDPTYCTCNYVDPHGVGACGSADFTIGDPLCPVMA